jgi:hypothetical protein
VGDCCEQCDDTSGSVRAGRSLTRWASLSVTRMTAAWNWLVNLVIEVVIFTASTLLCCILQFYSILWAPVNLALNFP